MSFEKENRLGADEAHEEANLLQASMEKKGKKATPEDYDRALEELEELKQLAAEDPKGLDKVKQRLTQLVVAGAFPIVLLGGVINETISLGGKGYKADVNETVDTLMSYFTKGEIAWTEAEGRLKALKYDAERMEE